MAAATIVVAEEMARLLCGDQGNGLKEGPGLRNTCGLMPWGSEVERHSLSQVSPLFGTIYDAVVLLAHALNRSESCGPGLSGAPLGGHTASLDVAGFSQRIQTDEKGRRLAQYVVLDTDGRGSQLVPTHILDTGTWQVQSLGRGHTLSRRCPSGT